MLFRSTHAHCAALTHVREFVCEGSSVLPPLYLGTFCAQGTVLDGDIGNGYMRKVLFQIGWSLMMNHQEYRCAYEEMRAREKPTRHAFWRWLGSSCASFSRLTGKRRSRCRYHRCCCRHCHPTTQSFPSRPILLFGLKTILPSRPACDLRNRAELRSMLPKAPEGRGIDGGEHGCMFAWIGMHRCVVHTWSIAKFL